MARSESRKRRSDRHRDGNPEKKRKHERESHRNKDKRGRSATSDDSEDEAYSKRKDLKRSKRSKEKRERTPEKKDKKRKKSDEKYRDRKDEKEKVKRRERRDDRRDDNIDDKYRDRQVEKRDDRRDDKRDRKLEKYNHKLDEKRDERRDARTRNKKSVSKSRERRRDRSSEKYVSKAKDTSSKSRFEKIPKTTEKKQEKVEKEEKPKESIEKKEESKNKESVPIISEQEAKRIAEEARKKAIIEAEQKIILETTEEERKKRRERIEQWREKIKKELGDSEIPEPTIEPTKSWNLEDENDDDDEVVTERPKSPEPDSNVDPLDAYMEELKESMSQPQNIIKTIIQDHDMDKPSIVQTVVTTQTKKKDVEILEQFGDAAEYSSEEESEAPITFVSHKQMKNLPPVDHNKVYYREFRKNFYVEVPEIAKLTDAEVSAWRLEMDNLIVKGKGCPKPVKKWVQLGVNPLILQVLKKSNYEAPTPIQAQAIPAIMSGRDVIGIAKTGSGKTIAFLLPMFRHVLDQPSMSEGDGPIAIVLTPTRELAVQIFRECRRFAKHLNLKVICLYGGSVVSEQIAELKRGAEIAICTPGRLIDMLSVNQGRITNCRRCTFLVLDEADRMFDLGFEPQVQKIIEQIRPDRQICLFTATFSIHMEALARKILVKPLEIIVGKRNKVCSDVKQHLLLLESSNKFLKLLEILGIYSEAGPVLIFVDRQEAADDLLKDLLTKGYPCMSIHGGRDQYDRDSSLNDFKAGNTNILVATSVAARGIDVKNIILVVNYDCPNHGEDYIHRCGRTGRMGSKGTAITFITPRDAQYLKGILTVVENTNCEIPQSIINLYQGFMASDKNRRIKSSGFSGHGYKFDEKELIHSCEQRKMIKWTFGWQDSGDEAEEESKVLKRIEQQIDASFGNRPKLGSGNETATVDKDKLQLAQSIASKLNQKLKSTAQNEILDQLVKPIPKPKPESLPVAKNLKLAQEIADKLNVKINPEVLKPAPKTESKRTLTAGEVFFEEIDINDFPQLARQRITTKETLDAVAELSDCSLTVRGSYCAGGKSMDVTDRRLHLLIEGTTEFKVQIAKAEVKRIIKEESIKSDYAFIQPSSRYKIT
ncbi:putative ATP-dependent RNA helicase DDX46 [Thelohanellus kitauei]|uniref:Probable ATP-dependent RNA helicase DDX46 n=1 Tax=Thelohanellus kitauei TaxID=669202 RepID=A0A0C2MSK2_THEKT|nr:putative ATP-dependent RNA helicase DDX46 [Thelohanellus kitauei]